MNYLNEQETNLFNDLDEQVFDTETRIFSEKGRGLLDEYEIEQLNEKLRKTIEQRDVLVILQDKRENEAFSNYVKEQFGDDPVEWFYISFGEEVEEIYDNPQYDELLHDHLGEFDDDQAEFLQRKSAEIFRAKYDLPATDTRLPPREPFPTFYKGIFVRGDSAFYCKMRGRTVFPLRD